MNSINYIIREVEDVNSPYLPEMVDWLNQIFPDYDPYFKTILTELRREDGRHEGAILIGLVENHVVGLLQIFFRKWRDGLIANIDLLGVLQPYRRAGIANALVQYSIGLTRTTAKRHEVFPFGIVSLIDPAYPPIVKLHQKLAAQIRREIAYRTPDRPNESSDTIAFYPLSDESRVVSTHELAWQLWQFGGLPEKEFIRRYGKPEYK
jgi:GNAT superfamily N-acetyltransferase